MMRGVGRMLSAVTIAAVLVGAAVAETYPSQPIRLIVTFPPGDVIALAKARPDTLSIGHGGNGTAMQLTAQW